MANVQPRKNKDGKIISYSIRVHKGRNAEGKQLKPYSMTLGTLKQVYYSSMERMQ